MVNRVIHSRSTSDVVAAKIRLFVAALASGNANGQAAGLIQGVQLRIANALLSEVQQAFQEKARGGTGSDGITWPPLKRETIAQRRIGAGDLAAIGIKGAGQPKSRVRGLLTKEQDKRWRQIFARTKAWLMAKFGMGEREAAGRAAQTAWARLKASGAKTKLEVLGGRKVDVLIDTGELARSFSPGVDATPSGADGQIFRVEPGRVTVGTNKKPWHHRKGRKFWRTDGTLPDSWWRTINLAANRGIQEGVVALVGAA